MARLLFVVHRAAPYPGGSEINTHRMAKEAVRQNHEVTVLADTNMGDFEGVHITGDRRVAYEKWDMIIVHGSCPTQDFVHCDPNITSPIYYILIEPPKKGSIGDIIGTKHATWIGFGTDEDWNYLLYHDDPTVMAKTRHFVYGLPHDAIGVSGRIRTALDVKTPHMIMSAGGYWPHKGFDELVTAFNEADLKESTLVLFGYATQYPVPRHGNERVMCVDGASSQDIYDAMADANLYVMNSESEGYGLTLLESMYNRTRWISRPIAAALELRRKGFGKHYYEYNGLVNALTAEATQLHPVIPYPHPVEYVKQHHMIEHSLASLLSVLS